MLIYLSVAMIAVLFCFCGLLEATCLFITFLGIGSCSEEISLGIATSYASEVTVESIKMSKLINQCRA
jgi:hypothetical protein